MKYERRFGAVLARGLQQIDRADGVDFEIVQRDFRGQVVRGLRGAVDDQRRSDAP